MVKITQVFGKYESIFRATALLSVLSCFSGLVAREEGADNEYSMESAEEAQYRGGPIISCCQSDVLILEQIQCKICSLKKDIADLKTLIVDGNEGIIEFLEEELEIISSDIAEIITQLSILTIIDAQIDTLIDGNITIIDQLSAIEIDLDNINIAISIVLSQLTAQIAALGDDIITEINITEASIIEAIELSGESICSKIELISSDLDLIESKIDDIDSDLSIVDVNVSIIDTSVSIIDLKSNTILDNTGSISDQLNNVNISISDSFTSITDQLNSFQDDITSRIMRLEELFLGEAC